MDCVICQTPCDSSGLCEKHKYDEQLTVTEHAVRMSDGSMCVRPNDYTTERIYPLATWIKSHSRFGGKVYSRQIAVLTDWAEVTPNDD